MNRILKADWYKLSKHKKIIIYFVLLSILYLSISYIDGESHTSYFEMLCTESSGLIMMILSIVAAVFTCTGFFDNTAFYEVMTGNSIHKIIVSKLTVICLYVSTTYMILYLAANFIYNTIYDKSNPKDYFVSLVLLYVIFLHCSLIGVMGVLASRQPAGIAVSYIRIMFIDELFLMIVGLFPEKCSGISLWSIQMQFFQLASDSISTELVLKIIVSTIIELAIWYVISYIGYKKKKFK